MENWDHYGCLEGYENGDAIYESKEDLGMEDFEELCSAFGIFQENFEGKENQETTFDDHLVQNYLNQQGVGVSQTIELIDCVNHQTRVSEVGKLVNEKPNSFPLASLNLLSTYGQGSKKLIEPNLINLADETMVNRQNMSINDILRLAGEKYLQFSTQRIDGFSMFIHPYGSSYSGVSDMEETRDVELVNVLLLAADKVAAQQFDLANKFITRCRWEASSSGNPIQRNVFYFAEALQNRIDNATGKIIPQKMNERVENAKHLGLSTNPEFLAWHQKLPFSQVTQIVGIQSIIENVKNATKIHLIDLEIRSGVQWTALMQALAEQNHMKTEHLKITAIGTTDRYKMEETGKRLSSFAKSMNLSFSFNVVFLPDMKSIKEGFTNVEPDETVAVYCSSVLRSMISTPETLDNLMKAIRSVKPSTMVVIEIEANHNSPSFLNRFIESLFFHGAFFDCLEDCMERDDEYRLALEGLHLGEGIKNMIATEGDERVIRNVKIDVWRAYFARFRMEEIEVSESCLYQASLVLKQFVRGDACNLDRNGKGLIVGWKGTPIHSFTNWKFL